MPIPFKDHFSTCAASYAKHRPQYPRALFDFVGSLNGRYRVAWDCATGNGQAALALVPYVDRIIATDASATQIAQAVPHPHVEYRVATAEESGIAERSVDLITVAQAFHWFDLDRFFAEVRRVAVPDATIAVWSYGDPMLGDATLNDALQRFNGETLAAYWPRERHAVGAGYSHLPFPFREVVSPALALEQLWTLDEFIGYLRTWSAVTAYRAAHQEDPVTTFAHELAAHWRGEQTTHVVRWPLTIRAGYVEVAA